MKILFLILNKTEKLDDILENFVKIGVRGATILDSQGMGSALAENDIPMLGGLLRSVMDNNRPYNKVVFSLINDEETLDKAIQSIEDVLGDMSKPGVGLIFTLDVDRVIGITGEKGPNK